MEVFVLLSKLKGKSTKNARHEEAIYDSKTSKKIKEFLKSGIRPNFNDIIHCQGTFYKSFYVFRIDLEVESEEPYLRVWAFEQEKPFEVATKEYDKLRDILTEKTKKHSNQCHKGKVLQLREKK